METERNTAAPLGTAARWIWGPGRNHTAPPEEASQLWLRLLVHFLMIGLVLYLFVPA